MTPGEQSMNVRGNECENTQLSVVHVPHHMDHSLN